MALLLVLLPICTAVAIILMISQILFFRIFTWLIIEGDIILDDIDVIIDVDSSLWLVIINCTLINMFFYGHALVGFRVGHAFATRQW